MADIRSAAIVFRMWYWVFHAFTAAVCQAVLVIVAPFHPLANFAFESMQAALELFESTESDRARSAATKLRPLAAKASKILEASRNASQAGSIPRDTRPLPTVGKRQPWSSSSARRGVGRNRFPTSNLRGKPEELLGASTKLVRLQPETAPALPHIPPSLSQAEDTNSSATVPVSPHTQAQTSAAPEQAQFPTQFVFDWGVEPPPGFEPSIEGNPDNVQLPSDTSLDLNIDDFDLMSFIQNGADAAAWLLDPRADSEVRRDAPGIWILWRSLKPLCFS